MFPLSRCPLCAGYDGCFSRGRAESDYPKCQKPLLGTDLAKVRSLFAKWTAFHQIGDDAIARSEAVLFERFGADRLRYSEILEGSFSADSEGPHLYRYSYAFPGWRADPVATVRTILSLVAPFGDRITVTFKALLRALTDPAVEQPLFGVAYDSRESYRLKLYLQFREGASEAAFRLSERLLGDARLGKTLGAKPLHMLGIDVGPRGLRGAKLYLHVPTFRIGEGLYSSPLIDALKELSVKELNNVLLIHRIEGQEDPKMSTPVELDFGLTDSELRFGDLAALAPIRSMVGAQSPFADLEASFQIGVRRISVPIGRSDKLNVYYVLRDRDVSLRSEDPHVDQPRQK